jgi:hypothetical protein
MVSFFHLMLRSGRDDVRPTVFSRSATGHTTLMLFRKLLGRVVVIQKRRSAASLGTAESRSTDRETIALQPAVHARRVLLYPKEK